jgi:phospholipid/cholesterol/gamma-HCH transport system permease protein
LLFGLVAIVGVAGGYYFNVVLQGVTPGAYIQGFSALSKGSDLAVGFIKAALFGVTAGIVAAFRGLNPSGGPKGVGDAVNQSVVITFILLFAINVIVTAVYLNIVPPSKF